MKRLVKFLAKKNKGFTLIEMIVVVAIIAILVAIAVPQAFNQVNKARKNADIANARNILMAIQQYEAEGNALPTDNSWKEVDSTIVKYLNGTVPKPKYSNYKIFCYKYDTSSQIVHIGVSDNTTNLGDSNVIEIYPNPEDPYNQP